jgi:hypothetical protein
VTSIGGKQLYFFPLLNDFSEFEKDNEAEETELKELNGTSDAKEAEREIKVGSNGIIFIFCNISE